MKRTEFAASFQTHSFLFKTLAVALNIVIGLTGVPGEARPSEQYRQPDPLRAADPGTRTQALIQQLIAQDSIPPVEGALSDWRRQNFDSIFAMDNAQLDWPQMPRDWVEHNVSRQYSSNTAIGIRSSYSNPVWTNFKSTIEFRYNVKTAFIIVASRSPANSPASTQPGPVRFDVGRYAAYPNVQPRSPMVGMCAFEMSFNIDSGRSNATEVALPGGIVPYLNQTTTTNAVRGYVHTHFSPFFQLDGDISVETYLNGVCDGIFRARKQEMMIAQATGQILSMFWNYNPRSSCRPPSPEQGRLVEGDPSCMAWFNTFNSSVRSLTMPRCEFQSNGSHQCVLRARREGVRCTLVLDPTTGQYVSELPTSRTSVRTVTTNPVHAYPCDRSTGLECQMARAPRSIGGLRLTDGEARCVASH